jgi:hypothetical protein
MKICSLGAELLHEDGRTNRHEEANSNVSQILRKCLKMQFLALKAIKILWTVGKHWPKNTASDLSSLQYSAKSLGRLHTLQSVTDLVNMRSAHTFHTNVTDKPQTDHKDACVQICVA